jgi:hypothetical protein
MHKCTSLFHHGAYVEPYSAIEIYDTVVRVEATVATNGCYCTVRCTTVVGVVSLTGVESRFPRTIPRPLYTGKLQYKNYSCVGMLPFKDPLLVTTKSATSNTYNAAKLVLYVSAYFQYLSHIAACKYNHVATVVAGGPNSPTTGAFASQLHCHFQWKEGPHVETHNVLVLQKETCKIQSKPGLY